MNVYISGKITGLPEDKVKEKFKQASDQIIAAGHFPVNPLLNGLPFDAPWDLHIAKDVKLLLGCHAIYLLSDWAESKGSRIEAYMAAECGLKIIHQPEYAVYKGKTNQ